MFVLIFHVFAPIYCCFTLRVFFLAFKTSFLSAADGGASEQIPNGCRHTIKNSHGNNAHDVLKNATATLLQKLLDLCVVINMPHLTGLLFCLFHREEGQEGDEGPVNPPQPSREKQRSHSKSKKTRREYRHAEREAETAASGIPSTAALPPQTVEEQQVMAHERKKCVDRLVSFSFPLHRPHSR